MRLDFPQSEGTMVSRYFRISLIALSAVIAGCKDMGTEMQDPSSTAPAQGGTVSFTMDVLPILTNAGCVECHGGSGGLTVGTVPQLLIGGDHGPAVIPGNADGSNLVRKLQTPPPFGARMPFGALPLPDVSIVVIRNWINQGATNN
jgi:hypothetical protein